MNFIFLFFLYFCFIINTLYIYINCQSCGSDYDIDETGLKYVWVDKVSNDIRMDMAFQKITLNDTIYPAYVFGKIHPFGNGIEDYNIYYYTDGNGGSISEGWKTVPMISWDDSYPDRRFGASSIMFEDSWFIYSGRRSGGNDFLTDMWRIDFDDYFVDAPGKGLWREVTFTDGDAPIGKYGAAMGLLPDSVVKTEETLNIKKDGINQEITVTQASAYVIYYGGRANPQKPKQDVWILHLNDTGSYPVCDSSKVSNDPDCSNHQSLRRDTIGTWYEVTPLWTGPEARAQVGSIILEAPDEYRECLWVFGGWFQGGNRIYNDLWRLCPEYSVPKIFNETIYVNGTEKNITRTVYTDEIIPEYTNWNWTKVEPDGPLPGRRHSSHIVPVYGAPGRFILYGGQDPNGDEWNDIWEYDAGVNRWREIKIENPNELFDRNEHAIWSLEDGLLVFGGITSRTQAIGTSAKLNYTASVCLGGYQQSYCNETSNFVCTGCIQGTSAENGTYNCSICSEGTYAPFDNMKSCFQCDSGKYGTEKGAISSSTCQDCPYGTEQPYRGQSFISSCQSCGYGRYSTIGSASCSDCIAGKFANQTRLDSCYSCNFGKYSSGRAKNCDNCIGGTYGPIQELSECLNCAPGYYSNSGESICQACNIGKYNPNSNGNSSSSCIDCERGTYNNNIGSSSCTKCPKGKYANETGATTSAICQTCEEGKYSLAGSTECTSCPAGKYQNSTESSDCILCPIGKYSTKIGATNITTCKFCPIGKWVYTKGSDELSDCELCPAGTYNLGIYGEPCEKCQRGKYTSTIDDAANSNCTLCAQLEYNNERGQSSCASCTSNYFSHDQYIGCLSCDLKTDCPKGPNNIECSDNGICEYGVCQCNNGWEGADCSENVTLACPTCIGYVGFTEESRRQYIYEGDSAYLTLYRSLGQSGSGSIDIEIIGGNSTIGIDYDTGIWPYTVSFADGEYEKTINFNIIDDNIRDEGCETILFNLTNPINVGRVSNHGIRELDNKATIYIFNNDFTSIINEQTDITFNTLNGNKSTGITPSYYDIILSKDYLDLSFDIEIPTNNGVDWNNLDLFILQDVSSSMANIVRMAKLLYHDFSSYITSNFNYPSIGLGSFSDKPVSPHGSSGSGDYEYNTDQILNFNYERTIYNTYNSLNIVGSGDTKGSQLNALYQSISRQNEIGWRDNSAKIIVIITDSEYHVEGDYASASSSNDLDLITDVSEDYVNEDNIRDALELYGVVPIFVVPSSIRSTYDTLISTLGRGISLTLSDDYRNIYDQIKIGINNITNSAYLSINSDPNNVVHSITPSDMVYNLSPGSTQTFNVNLTSLSSFINGSVILDYAGYKTIIKYNYNYPECPNWVNKITPSYRNKYYEQDLAQIGIVQGFWPDEELDWQFTVPQGNIEIQEVDGPYYNTKVYALNMSSCNGISCGSVSASIDIKIDHKNLIPLIFKTYTKSQNVIASTYEMEVELKKESNTKFKSTDILKFNDGTYDWKYKSALYYPTSYVEKATITLKFEGSGSILWYGVSILPEPDYACLCDSGYFPDSSHVAAEACTPQISCRYNLTQCTSCEAGYFCNGGLKRQCSGTLFSFGTASECSDCQDGWICSNGKTVPCSASYNKISVNGEYCALCPSGSYCRNGVSYKCDVGKYSPGGQNSVQCAACEPGTYTNVTGSSNCTYCPAGKTSNNGRNDCFDCEPGEYSMRGQHPCSSCPKGSYSASHGSSDCDLCAIGKYAPKVGMRECLSCPNGKTTSGEGSISKSSCI